MAIEGIITSPSFIKVRTVDGKERFLNSNLVEEISPSDDDNNVSDVFMLSGSVVKVKETTSQLLENRYRRDVKNGATIINFLG